MLIKKLTNYIFNSDYRAVALDLHGFHPLDDEEFLKKKFKLSMGYELAIDNPQTFNEKLQWLKLYDRKPIYTTMVDKYAAKGYVADKVGDEYIIPTLGVWDKYEEIDFSLLPKQFVLKCTHDSGGVIICKDKEIFDFRYAEKRIKKSLNTNFFLLGREWPYKNVRPRVIAEEYMSDTGREGLTDYKFMCFDGKVKCIFTVTERFSKSGIKVTFFDLEWNPLPFERHYPRSSVRIAKPYNLDKMIELAERLADGITFVRVDLYESNKNIYFGEMTFYPGGGYEEFSPVEWDYTLGSWIDLSIVERQEDNNYVK